VYAGDRVCGRGVRGAHDPIGDVAMRKYISVPVLIFGLAVAAVAGYQILRPESTRPVTVAAADTSGASAPASDRCAPADFSLSKVREITKYDEATLTGVITNHCSSSAGVRLKWTAYNGDGSVAFSTDFWPASTTNIAPGSQYAFQMMYPSPRGRWTYHVEPEGVSIW
jgi:hypothetical protein